MIEDQLVAWIGEGLVGAAPALGLEGDLPVPELLAPKQKEHGDFATNVALGLAKRAGKPPREVAQAIVDALPPAPFVERVEIAGPGFLNVFTTDEWLHDGAPRRGRGGRGVRTCRADRPARAGRVREREPDRSAAHRARPERRARGRPRAPPRGRRLDRRARVLLQRRGPADGPVRRSRSRRGTCSALGREAEVPEEGYHGAYLVELAEDIRAEHGDALADLPPEERRARLLAEGSRRVLAQIEATLDRFGVRFDVYFSEAELARKGEIDAAIERLRAAGYAYDAEGAVWFRSTEFGDDKDRVVIRSNGAHTYFGADCAYLLDKFSRGFDHVVYVWGADHHGDVKRVKGAAQALGYRSGRGRDRAVPVRLVPAERRGREDEQAVGRRS